MFNIDVRDVSGYKELLIETSENSYTSSFLDEAEAAYVAEKLIVAARELLSKDYSIQIDLLSVIENNLG